MIQELSQYIWEVATFIYPFPTFSYIHCMVKIPYMDGMDFCSLHVHVLKSSITVPNPKPPPAPKPEGRRNLWRHGGRSQPPSLVAICWIRGHDKPRLMGVAPSILSRWYKKIWIPSWEQTHIPFQHTFFCPWFSQVPLVGYVIGSWRVIMCLMICSLFFCPSSCAGFVAT